MQASIRSNSRGLRLLIVLGRDLALAAASVGGALLVGAWLQSLALG
ncbi:hypothetical protein [Rubellimicrobium roseum]|nr:hypothetical protein [Rubellimicrobium roseum]